MGNKQITFPKGAKVIGGEINCITGETKLILRQGRNVYRFKGEFRQQLTFEAVPLTHWRMHGEAIFDMNEEKGACDGQYHSP